MRSRKLLIWITAIAGGLALLVAAPNVAALLLFMGMVWAVIALSVRWIRHTSFRKPAKPALPPVCDYCGYAYESHEWDGGTLLCPSPYPAPAGERRKRAAIPQDVLIAVANRDGGRCTECGSREDLQYDHVIPHSLNGADTVRNLRLLCGTCNRRKGAKVR